MSIAPLDALGPSDAELIEAVRGGDLSAYGVLFERHVDAARRLARNLARSAIEADDLVSMAFTKVLDMLRAGRGPDSAFRAYLLTAVRHLAYDNTRRDRKLELVDELDDSAAPDVTALFADSATTRQRDLAAEAFARLPERWQTVLWHTEIEGQSATEVAPLLGLTPNGVSALAYRAREGLRQAFLQVHISGADDERCRAAADRLGSWTRGGLSKRETAQVESHLDDCGRCRALAAELADINLALRSHVAPLVLGAGAVAYLATTAKVTAAFSAGAVGAVAGGSAMPRQLVGAAASVAALAVAVTMAASPQVPVAQHSTAPPTSSQLIPTPTSTPLPSAAPPSSAGFPSPLHSGPTSPPAPTTVAGAPVATTATSAALTLQATPANGNSGRSELTITATNTGAATGPVTVVLTPPAEVTTSQPATCATTESSTTCTTSADLLPGAALVLQARITRRDDQAREGGAGEPPTPQYGHPRTVTATLGSATETLTIDHH